MRHALHFTIAVLSDQLGVAPLCAAAESVRWQWPFARILILGRIPAAMKDQLYDEVAVHSLDENAFLSTIEKLANHPWKQMSDPLAVYVQAPNAQLRTARAIEMKESDPTKLAAFIPQGVHARDLPSDLHIWHRRG